MKLEFAIVPGLLAILTATPAFAVTDTWDGGSFVSDNLLDGANWVDGTAPASNLVNTDLIFAGGVRLSPDLTAAFSTHSITFDNSAGAFFLSGSQFNVGTGGISNDDIQTMGFGNVVSFAGVANATIDAAAGGLTFNNTVVLPASTLTVTGGDPTSFRNFGGATAVLKAGSGTMTWSPTALIQHNVTISAGTLSTGADGTTDIFSSAAAIAVNGTGAFNINENLTLDAGPLTQADSADVNLASGKTLAIQNGGDASITGTFTNDTASTIAVTGAGSTFSTTSTLSLIGGSTTTVSAGGSISTGTGTISIGTNGNGTATVSGSGSSLTGGTLTLGLNGDDGSLTFNPGTTGAFGQINVGDSGVAGSSGILNILGGAVTGAGLDLAPQNAATTGSLTVSGSGAVLTLSGVGTADIGAAGDSTGTLNVNTSGVFNSGTGLTAVKPTGTISISGGTYNANGNLTIDGGRLLRNASGTFALDAGTTFTVQNGGDATITGIYENTTASTITITGAGSTFSTSSSLNLIGGSTTNVLAGGSVSSGVGAISVGTNGNGTLLVDGAGSSFGGAQIFFGQSGFAGSGTFSNGGTGTFTGGINVANSGIAGSSGTLSIQSGATVTGTGLQIARSLAPVAVSGATTITGAGSVLTVSGAGTTLLGAASANSATLNVQAGGTFHSGTGLTQVNTTGKIAITGGTFNANGNIDLNGGQLTRDIPGNLAIDAGTTFTVLAGGDATFDGNFIDQTASTVRVTGTGSTLTTTGGGNLQIQGGATLNVAAGGSVASAGQFNVGAFVGDGTATVDGAGSSVSAAGFSNIALNGFTGSLTFTNNSTGTFAGIGVGASTIAATNGLLSIQSGADVTAANLSVGSNTGANSGVATVTGAGSTLTLTGAASAIIGAAAGGDGTLNVNSGAVFDSGTGLTTVNALGTIAIGGGTFNARGNLTLNGGQLTRDSSGTLAIDAGTTLTVQNGGDLTLDGTYTHTTASVISITGAGSTLASTSGNLFFFGGAQVSVLAGADLTSEDFIALAGNNGGTLTIDGAGTTLNTGGTSLLVGTISSSAADFLATFRNGSTGTLGSLSVQIGAANRTSHVQIESGATVTATGGSIGNQGISTAASSVTVSGAGSSLTYSGASFTSVGTVSPGGTNSLNVQDNGTCTAGNATVNVNGVIAITGGMFNANGNLTVNGRLTRDAAGTFTLGAGQALSVQGGGDAVFNGNYNTPNSATIAVTGAGSTFSTSGTIQIGGGTAVNVFAGGSVSANIANVGSFGGSATATIDGAGSSLTATTLSVGQNGNTGTLTFSNGSTGSFGNITVDFPAFAGTVGTLNIQSGSTVAGSNLNLASVNLANTGSVLITGPGSVLALTGAATIGAASATSGTLTVESGGTFTTGATTTINATGSLTIQTGATLTGASDYAGVGPLTLAGAYLPGTAAGPNRTTSVSFAQNITLQPTTSITMELGGVTAGTQHDQLVFNGTGTPHITWHGTLNIMLLPGFAPAAGQSFDIFDFDSARDAGTFTSVNLPAPGAGLVWNTDDLYITGVIRVVSTGLTFAQWAAANGMAGALPDGDHDSDGYDNAAEFALGLFPPQPGTVLPNGGFHTYPDGERLRLLFTRPLDRTGLTIKVQAGSNLTTWTDLATSVDSAPFTGPGFVSENRAHPLSEPGLVEVRDTVDPANGARRYLRIHLVLAP